MHFLKNLFIGQKKLKKNKNLKISNSLECVVCLNEFKRNEEYLSIYKQKTKCGCPVCNECQTQWMIQKIDQIDFNINNTQLQCCQCKQNIKIEQFFEKITMDKELDDNFDQKNDQNNENYRNKNDTINTNYIDMINEKLTRKYAQQDQEMVMCPKEGCKFIGFKEKQWWRQKSCFECEICEKQYPLFNNSSIKGYKLKEFMTWVYKIIKCQKCPNCKSYIQKNGGCNNMHCSQCKKNFCWQCGQLNNQHNSFYCGFIGLRIMILYFMFIGLPIIYLLYKIGVFGYVIKALYWIFVTFIGYNILFAMIGFQIYNQAFMISQNYNRPRNTFTTKTLYVIIIGYMYILHNYIPDLPLSFAFYYFLIEFFTIVLIAGSIFVFYFCQNQRHRSRRIALRYY